ncbi:MAG: chemotaxis protein CheD [Actinomycetota bacterium]|nr:chemotaxis protein CheD [Actinomycetota bacterium]
MPEVFLHPGDYHFGGAGTRIHTVLGSCVSITVWHPTLRLGGMCHYMLPARPRTDQGPPDPRYADGAIGLFLRDVRRANTAPGQYEVKMFGGGRQFPESGIPAPLDVARHNIDAGIALLERHDFALAVSDLGGTGARRLIFDIGTGDVWLRTLDRSHDRDEATA